MLDFLRRVFVHSDLLLGIFAKAAGALEAMIMDPVGFLGNLFGALRQGLGQFVANVGRHLINGLLGWLLGPLEEMGIRPPTELTLSSVLDFVLQRTRKVRGGVISRGRPRVCGSR